MKKLILIASAAVLTSGMISESWATPTCNCGKINTSDCCWEIDSNGVMNITGIGEMADFEYDEDFHTTDVPWHNQNFTSVIITGITSVGSNAFRYANSLTGVDMPDVTSVGSDAFFYASALTDVNMPNVKTIGGSAFSGASSLTGVDMPNVTSIGNNAFGDASNLSYIGLQMDSQGFLTDENGNRKLHTDTTGMPEFPCVNFYDGTWDTANNACILGTEVQIAVDAFSRTPVSGCSSTNRSACGSCGDNYIKSGQGCVTAENCGTGFTADAETKRCVASPQQISESDCYANGQVFYQDACVDEYPFAKKHWTPAEAAQYLKDTDNEIIMTFKVNR